MSGSRPGAAIISLAVGSFSIGTVEFAMMGLLPNIAEGVNVSISTAGTFISAYAIGVVVGAPALTAFTAHMPRKAVALAFMAMVAVGNLSSFFAPDATSLLVTRFLAGLPHGAYFGVASIIAASLTCPTKRARAISLVILGLSVANVVGVPVATFVGQHWGWRLLFLIVGTIGAIAVAAIAVTVPRVPAHEGASVRAEFKALQQPQVWLALLVGIVGFGGFFAVYTYIAPTITEVTGLDEHWVPLAVGLYGIGMVVGNVAGGRLADRSVMGSIYWSLVGITVVLASFTVAARNPFTALPVVFLIGASGAVLVPALQTRLLDVAPAGSVASSMNHSALNIANALGAFLGGLVISWGWGFNAPALVGAVLALLGLGVAALSGALDRRAFAAGSG